jgi:phospholipase/carboxylesterase
MSRDFYIHREERGAKGAPLLFLFHGTGGDENNLVRLGQQLLPHAHIVSPRGDVSEGGALRFFRRTGEGMYDMADLAQRVERMMAFVRVIRDEYAAPKTIALGYSNGANIIAATQFADPSLFEEAVLMHPLIPFEPAKADFSGKRVLITAGRQDPICPPVMTEMLAAYYRDNKAALDIFWHQGGHEIGTGEVNAIAKFLNPQGVA